MEWRGRLPLATPPCRHLRGHVAVDVLVEPAGVRTRVGTEAPVEILRATLVDVGAVSVVVAALTRIRAGDHVPPIGPDAVRERPDRADVEIVAAEGHGSAAELLVVRVALRGRQLCRARPCQGR